MLPAFHESINAAGGIRHALTKHGPNDWDLTVHCACGWRLKGDWYDVTRAGRKHLHDVAQWPGHHAEDDCAPPDPASQTVAAMFASVLP